MEMTTARRHKINTIYNTTDFWYRPCYRKFSSAHASTSYSRGRPYIT